MAYIEKQEISENPYAAQGNHRYVECLGFEFDLRAKEIVVRTECTTMLDEIELVRQRVNITLVANNDTQVDKQGNYLPEGQEGTGEYDFYMTLLFNQHLDINYMINKAIERADKQGRFNVR